MGGLKWILGLLDEYKDKLIWGIVLSITGVGLNFINPLLFARIIDDVIEGGNRDMLMPLILTVIFCTSIRACLIYFSGVLIEQCSQNTVKKLRTSLYDKLQKLDTRFYSSNRTGDLMMKLTGDLDWVRHFIAWIIPQTISNILIFLATLIVFFCINPLLTLFGIILAPLTAILTVRVRRVMRPAHDRVRAEVSRLNTVVQENISGNRVVKAFVREKYEIDRFEECNAAYRDAAINTTVTWWRFNPFLEAVAYGMTIVLLAMGGIFVIKGNMTLGALSIFLNLTWGLNDPMRLIGIIINDYQRFLASTEKVMTIFYAKPEIKTPEESYVAKNPTGKVEYKNVSFKYGNNQVLTDINFHAEPGETIGIMGPTGSGKTTFISLMARFMDVSDGSILVDGHDVREYDLQSLRGIIGMATQDVFLFSDSIDSNIAYGKPESSDEHVIACAIDADADEFIRRMPLGYDTIIGERGVGLSGGQRQRVALARALAYDTPILILDDTTSAVDMETEHYIQGRLRGRKRKATTIIIAQRISSVKDADRIYIIEGGRITEVGTHEELLRNKGYYHSIYNLQQGIASKGGEE
ncbi:MAG: ABC transporter ATP-binding protein [Clostridiales bacterium]|nr:ABC transporter ATP-binding protein [Clostridiales bacterium]